MLKNEKNLFWPVMFLATLFGLLFMCILYNDVDARYEQLIEDYADATDLAADLLADYEAANAKARVFDCMLSHSCKYAVMDSIAAATDYEWTTQGVSGGPEATICNEIMLSDGGSQFDLTDTQIVAVCVLPAGKSQSLILEIGQIYPNTAP